MARPRKKTQKEILGESKANDIIQFNSDAERAFVELVHAILENEESATQIDLIREAAFELDISPVTAKRYLLKYTARRAPFKFEDKRIWLR